jgi:hypothetical protein
MTARVRLIAAATAAFAVLASAPLAGAANLYEIHGTVRDKLGAPVANAVVTDGTRTARTAGDGTYTLAESGPGTYQLRATGDLLLAQSRQVTLVTPGATASDFDLDLGIAGTVSPSSVTTSSGDSHPLVQVRVVESAADECVTVTDARTATSTAAAFAGFVAGAATFETSITAPAGLTEGAYTVSYQLKRCASGVTLSPKGSRSWRVDNTPPTVGVISPSGWTSGNPIISASVTDASGLDLGATTIQVDDLPYPAVLQAGRLVANSVVLASGHHSVAFHVVDVAGNTTDQSSVFDADVDAPVFSNETPSTTIADPSPRLAIDVEDAGAGADWANASMVLTSFAGNCTLKPTWDQAHTIFFDVPDIPGGVCPGQMPLAPGSYTVAATVADVVGNQATHTWTFTVSPAAQVMPARTARSSR